MNIKLSFFFHYIHQKDYALLILQIGLIIVDSVAMPLRGEIDHMRHMIMDFSCLLSSLAVSCRCVVCVSFSSLFLDTDFCK